MWLITLLSKETNMLVLSEVTLVNCTFPSENPSVTLEPSEVSELGESYVSIRGQVYLKKILPVSQPSIEFKLECAQSNLAHAKKDVEYYQGQVRDLHKEIDEGSCKPEWVSSYLEEYTSKGEQAAQKMNEYQEKITLLEQFIIKQD